VATKQKQLASIWRQIAQHFRNYDQRLLFAGMNEPAVGGRRLRLRAICSKIKNCHTVSASISKRSLMPCVPLEVAMPTASSLGKVLIPILTSLVSMIISLDSETVRASVL